MKKTSFRMSKPMGRLAGGFVRTLLCAALAAMLAFPAAAEEGYQAVVNWSGMYALADEEGNLLTDYIYSSYIMSKESEPPFPVKRDGKWGCIDGQGNEVVPVIYDDIAFPFEGLIAVELDGKWGYVDDAGIMVIEPLYDDALSFSDGLVAVKQDGKWGYADDTGIMVIEPLYDDALSFSDGLAAVKQNGKWGYIDHSGSYVIAPAYDVAESFSNGYAIVRTEKHYRVIDKTGTTLIETEGWTEFRGDEDGLLTVLNSGFHSYDFSSGTAVEVKSLGSSIDLSDYMPFEGSKVAVLDEPCALELDTSEGHRLPRLDGATALFPVYSAFCQAAYPEDTRYIGPYYVDDAAYVPITCTKTNVAYERLIDGEADIIFVAEPSDEELATAAVKGVEFDMIPIGKEAFVFIVNKDNPLDGITVDQIRDVYSGELTDWSQLGVDGIGPIMAYQRPKNSGSQTALEALMGDVPLMEAPQGFVSWDMGDIIDTIEYRNLPNAIGYSFRFFCTEMMEGDVKLLAVDGVEPTEANIRNGSYPITSTVYAIRLMGNDDPNVLALLDWIRSPQGMELIEKSGYTPWEY